MYFLTLAFSGLRRRFATSLLCFLATFILLISSASIGLWSYWLTWDESKPIVSRSATAFLSVDNQAQIDNLLEDILFLPGVYTAHNVEKAEFKSYLANSFPDFAEKIESIGDQVIPSVIELTFDKASQLAVRKNTLKKISVLPGVKRVEDGHEFVSSAMKPMQWLSSAGIALALGLWFVLILVALGHYQGILHRDWEEVQLIRSFGANRYWILLPWSVEALLHSLVGSALAVLAMWAGRFYLSALFNQFFDVLGYESFAVNLHLFLVMSLSLVLMSFIAHLSGGILAIFRGRVA